jgi:hypothetical protein
MERLTLQQTGWQQRACVDDDFLRQSAGLLHHLSQSKSTIFAFHGAMISALYHRTR